VHLDISVDAVFKMIQLEFSNIVGSTMTCHKWFFGDRQFKLQSDFFFSMGILTKNMNIDKIKLLIYLYTYDWNFKCFSVQIHTCCHSVLTHNSIKTTLSQILLSRWNNDFFSLFWKFETEELSCHTKSRSEWYVMLCV